MTTPPTNEQQLYRQVVLGQPVTRQLAAAMVNTPPTASVSRRWGVVSAITGNTLSVNIGGVTIPGVQRIANYAPTVGETVSLDVVAGDLVVVGTLLPSPLNDYHTRINSLSGTVTGHTSTLSTHTSQISALQSADTTLGGRVTDVESVGFLGDAVAATGTSPSTSTSMVSKAVTIPTGLPTGRVIHVLGYAHFVTPAGVGATIRVTSNDGFDAPRTLNVGALSCDLVIHISDSDLGSGARTYNVESQTTVGGQTLTWRSAYIGVWVQ